MDRGVKARVESDHPSLNPEAKSRGNIQTCPSVADNGFIPAWLQINEKITEDLTNLG